MNKESRSLPLLFKSPTSNFPSSLLTSLSPQPRNPNLASTTTRFKENSFINVFEDSSDKATSPTSVSTNTKLDFFNYYKNISRLSDRQRMRKEENSPTIAYLNSVVKLKLNPRAFGIMKNPGVESELDLRMFSIGDNYADPFSQGIKHHPLLQNLNLKNNRLTDKGNEKILSTIDYKHIERLTLAENKLGPRSLEKILQFISSYDCKLKYLNLEKTNFGESMFISLFTALNHNKILTKLILAKNNLSDRTAKSVKDMLAANNNLKVLDLHWNLIRSAGAMMIFEGLAKNTSLVILDLSWNSIGKSEIAFDAIGSAIKNNTSLLHLDLSYNYLIESDCQILAQYLKFNHTLLGFHVQGNECSVDSKGFLLADKKKKVEKSLFSRRIIEKQSYLHEIKSNCWVCEKWVEQTFTCRSQGKSVFIHLEFENYRPELMFNRKGDVHEITRVVPPEKVKFFFSELDDNEISSAYLKELESLEIDMCLYEGMSKHVLVNTVQVLTPNGEVCNIKSPFLTKPRTAENKYIPPADKMERIKWLFKNSIFKEYTGDSEKLLNDCLEFDWRHARVSNFIRNPEEQDSIKKLIKSNYPLIKSTYKMLCAYSGNDFLSIGTNVLNEFLNQCKVYDSLYQSSDFGVNLNSTLVPKEKGQLYNPGNALVRYEFIEMLVRIAMDRFFRNKICATYAQAMQKLLTDHLVPVMQEYKIEPWRVNEYFTEEVDLVLKANKDLFLTVYKKYSGRHTLPGKKNFMSTEEFRQVCIDTGIIGGNLATRECDMCFCQSMMTQVDELYNKRHLEMNFSEFLEAICRAIYMSKKTEDENAKINSLIQNRLSRKIEVFLECLLKICPQGFQDEFVVPGPEYYSKMMYRFVPGR